MSADAQQLARVELYRSVQFNAVTKIYEARPTLARTLQPMGGLAVASLVLATVAGSEGADDVVLAHDILELRYKQREHVDVLRGLPRAQRWQIILGRDEVRSRELVDNSNWQQALALWSVEASGVELERVRGE